MISSRFVKPSSKRPRLSNDATAYGLSAARLLTVQTLTCVYVMGVRVYRRRRFDYHKPVYIHLATDTVEGINSGVFDSSTGGGVSGFHLLPNRAPQTYTGGLGCWPC